MSTTAVILITLGAKIVADIGVRVSKKTENHIDDLIFNSIKSVIGSIGLFKKK